jgi:hypothetical protein
VDKYVGEVVWWCVEPNSRVGAKVVQRAQDLLVAARSDHPSGAEKLGDFDGEAAGDTSCAEDQDVFAGSELGAIGEREPSGDTRVGKSSGGVVIEGVGDRKGEGFGHDGELRHRSVRGARSAKEDALAVAEMADSVRAANDGEFPRAGVVRAAGELLVDRLKRGGVNADEDLAIAGDGFGELLTAGRLAECVKNGGVHEDSVRLLFSLIWVNLAREK